MPTQNKVSHTYDEYFCSLQKTHTCIVMRYALLILTSKISLSDDSSEAETKQLFTCAHPLLKHKTNARNLQAKYQYQ